MPTVFAYSSPRGYAAPSVVSEVWGGKGITMGERENGQAVERFWRALEKEDFEAAKAELHPDFVETYPQSGERLREVQNWLSLVTNYPGFPAIG